MTNYKTIIASEIWDHPDDSPRLRAMVDMMRGNTPLPEEPDEQLLPLKKVAETLSLHPTWLTKLQVHTNCGHRLAGRRRYALSEVKSYLQSPACDRRMEELRLKRKKGGR